MEVYLFVSGQELCSDKPFPSKILRKDPPPPCDGSAFLVVFHLPHFDAPFRVSRHERRAALIPVECGDLRCRSRHLVNLREICDLKVKKHRLENGIIEYGDLWL